MQYLKQYTTIFILILIVIMPLAVSAAGLVPCGGDKGDPCNFADLMTLIHKVIEFLLFKVAMPLAAVAFVIAGFMFMFYGDNEAKRSQAKRIFLNVLIGLIIALAAWLVVDLILDTLLSSEKFRLLEQN